MTRLSVIIVNYNVKYFLEQALHAVQKATANLSAEVLVVDNASVDGSVEMVREKFPSVILIANEENVGFSTANNQAIRVAKGEYVLLLNPDTVVEEDTFEKVVGFMDDHPDAGGLGVKMLDGKGNFLPESKRAFPSPSVAFYKIFGLAALFPKSKTFGKYHLGYLNDDQVHAVEVLAGAFMLLRKSVLDEIGLLDEEYFMYGEDIDLSYRIIKAGYKNYYYPDTRIIHYKGESTKKGSLNYVKLFYHAMIIFAKKHFSAQQARLFTFIIQLAIYFKAFLSVTSRFVGRAMPVFLDGAVLFGVMYGLKLFWEQNIKFPDGMVYPPEFLYVNVPLYILIWLLSVYFSGGYDKPVHTFRIVRGLLVGTVLIAAMYGFLPEDFRFSRAIILFGAAASIFALVGLRVLHHFLKYRNLQLEEVKEKKMIIVGNKEETDRVLNLLNQVGASLNYIGYITPREIEVKEENHLGHLSQLNEIIAIYRINEVIFCSKDVTSQQIIDWMTKVGPSIDYKIVPQESLSIIGSNSKDTAGDLYAIDINLAIASPQGKRNKRVLDVLISLGLLVTFPFHLFFVKNPVGFLQNVFSVLFGRRTWVGYVGGRALASKPNPRSKLPSIPPGVLDQKDLLKSDELDPATISRLNLLYAKDYSIWQDVNVLWKGYRQLGRG